MNRKQMIALVKYFIEQNDIELQNAALLLGGPSALMRLQRLRRAIAISDRIETKHRRELNWLSRLLGLDYADDLFGEEGDYFVMISPEDPAVITICLLTEQLNELIEKLEAKKSSSCEKTIDAAA